jgi:hypothetical protein
MDSIDWTYYPLWTALFIIISAVFVIISCIISVKAIFDTQKKQLTDKTIKHLYLFMLLGFTFLTVGIGINIIGYNITTGSLNVSIIPDKLIISWVLYLIYVHLLKFVPQNTNLFPWLNLSIILLSVVYLIVD